MIDERERNISDRMTNFALTAFCLFFGALKAASIGTAPQKCPVQNGNLLDVDLFVESDSECAAKCEKNEKCFYYFFYTAPTKNRQPPQCFLYETCDRLVEAAQSDCYIGKNNVVLLLSPHPPHYFKAKKT